MNEKPEFPIQLDNTPVEVLMWARTDEGVIDEISLAYKDLDSVIAAESDLVEVVQKLDTILCVKG